MSKEFKDLEAVILYAAGYEWICPNCGDLQRELNIPVIVQCSECCQDFIVSKGEHKEL